MPYLPPGVIDGGEFPAPFGKDIQIQIRMQDERYKRYYAPLPYFQLKKAVTPAPSPVPEVPSGEPATTQFDPLWGEPVPPTLEGESWVQPHLDVGDIHDATVTLQWEAPLNLNMRIQRENKEEDLKKWGFDKVRDIIAFVPLSLLDEQAVTVRVNDKFIWDDDEYIVLQHNRVGWFKNTNVRLLMALNCEHYRAGA